MKIIELINFSIPLTNEEQEFISSHPKRVSLSQLMDRDQVLARNLVRKGIYNISKDNQHLIRQDEKDS
jgi:hypothetical protein